MTSPSQSPATGRFSSCQSGSADSSADYLADGRAVRERGRSPPTIKIAFRADLRNSMLRSRHHLRMDTPGIIVHDSECGDLTGTDAIAGRTSAELVRASRSFTTARCTSSRKRGCVGLRPQDGKRIQQIRCQKLQFQVLPVGANGAVLASETTSRGRGHTFECSPRITLGSGGHRDPGDRGRRDILTRSEHALLYP